MDNKEIQRASYNKNIREYGVSVARVHQVLASYTLDVWKKRCAGKEIFEIGCGGAYVLEELLNSRVNYKSYVGVDIAEEIIKSNSVRYAELNNVRFVDDDAETLNKIDAKKYDVAISYGCLHHLENPDSAIENIFGKLKESGVFFAVEVNKIHPVAYFPSLYLHIFGVDAEGAFYKMLKRVGLYAFKLFSFWGNRGLKKQGAYRNAHPGHPGTRTPVELAAALRDVGFKEVSVKCLYLELFPPFVYRLHPIIFKFQAAVSRYVLKNSVFRDKGLVLIVEAKK